MTRSLTKDLFTPFKELERVFHSKRKLFETPSLDYSNSPEFGLLSDPENQSKEEVAEVMREPTMEEYMMKTREDYVSGIARPKIDDKAHFELKGQFLKELRDNIQILNSKDAIPTIKAADAKVAIQEIADHSQKWLNRTSTRARSTETFDGLAAIQAQLNNHGREIKKVNEKVYAAQVGFESYGGPHYSKDCPLKKEAKLFEESC
ncbi:hypothetical protein Tco_0531029 [Tanacetum coccineum]